MQPYMVTNGCHWRKYLLVKSLENPGIDPGTSHIAKRALYHLS